MGVKLKCVFFVTQLAILSLVKTEDGVFTINTMKPLHTVNEKFLSVSIDPAILLTRINLSDISQELARHLSPAYVRIAGPATKYVKYIDTDDISIEHSPDETANIVVTPSVWFAINEWFRATNLTPIFGINDAETAKGIWNPKSILPLLEMSDKFNVTCLWQLGYDCTNKSERRYKEDLKVLRHILDAFPEKKDVWNIIASDISRCYPSNRPEVIKRLLDDLSQDVGATMWEPENTEVDFQEKEDTMNSFLHLHKTHPKIWTVEPKPSRSVTFTSALEWAKQVGDAAKNGYDVIFRQPRMHELFMETPVYWFSLLYKQLMGTTILDVRHSEHDSEVDIYACCTKKQNSYIRRGAMTVLLINDQNVEKKAQLRIGMMSRNLEIQSYILTSPDNSVDVHLNNEKLTMDLLKDYKLEFAPKLRRAKPTMKLVLSVPPNSIGFFVLPDARISACINEEDENTLLLMEEIREDQNISLFPDFPQINVVTRVLENKPSTLQDIQKNMEKEFESDERFYKSKMGKVTKVNKKLEGVMKNLEEKYKERKTYNLEEKSSNDTKTTLLEKMSETRKKLRESTKPKTDWTQLLTKVNHLTKSEDKIESTTIKQGINFEIDSSEVKKILTDRVKAKAARKKIIFSSAELDDLMTKATRKLKHENGLVTKFRVKRSLKTENVQPKKYFNKQLLKLRDQRARRNELVKSNLDRRQKFKLRTLKTIGRRRVQRDINMKLLEETHTSKNSHGNLETKKGAIRRKDTKISSALTSEEELKENLRKKLKLYVATRREKSHSIPTFQSKKLKKFDESEEEEWFSEEDSKDFKNMEKYTPHESLKIGGARDSYLSELFGTNKEMSPPLHIRGFDIYQDDDDSNSPYKRLDQYFKNAKEMQEKMDGIQFSNEDDYDNIESDEYPVRFKRDNHITKDDISMYRKFMKTNLKYMKELERSGMVVDKKTLVEDMIRVIDSNKENSSLNKYHSDLGKPYEASKVKITDNLKKTFLDILKNRLALKRQYNLKKKIATLDKFTSVTTPPNESTSLANTNTTEGTTREKRYAEDVFHNYKPLRDNIKEWKPADIHSLRKNTNLLPRYFAAHSVNDLPYYNYLLPKTQSKRSLKPDTKYLYNDAYDYLNEIQKEGMLNRVDFDKENGDYQLILPNKDKIELKEQNGNTQLIFQHKKDQNIESTQQVISSTESSWTSSEGKLSTIEGLNTENGFNNTELMAITGNLEISTQTDTDWFDSPVNHSDPILREDSNIQRIPSKPELFETVFNELYQSLNDFFQNIGTKISDYYHHITG